MLVCARLRYTAGKEWGTKRYLCMNYLRENDQDIAWGAASAACEAKGLDAKRHGCTALDSRHHFRYNAIMPPYPI